MAILVCESGLFLQKGPNFLGRHGPILRLTFMKHFDFLDFVRCSEFLGVFFYFTGLQDPCAMQCILGDE